jgi:hypothetical protein
MFDFFVFRIRALANDAEFDSGGNIHATLSANLLFHGSLD